MDQQTMLNYFLDSWPEPIVLVDTKHIIRYMNSRAKNVNYVKWGDITGKSIFACHNQKSGEMIKAIFQKLEDGEEEALYSSNNQNRIYMRAVRDSRGNLVGYYERYASPVEGSET